MIEFDVKIELDPAFLKTLEEKARQALEITADQVYSDLVDSHTMPMDTGNLQNHLTIVVAKDDEVRLVSIGPYARRLYYHPDFNFRIDKNPNAGAHWFDPYLPGHAKGDFVPIEYAKFLKSKLDQGG